MPAKLGGTPGATVGAGPSNSHPVGEDEDLTT